MGKSILKEPSAGGQESPLADGISNQSATRFEQLLKIQAGENRSAHFRVVASSTFKFFDTLPDARAWAEHIVRSDFPEICVEEDVDGGWELREIHFAAKP